ncbi:MAG: thioredoxin domain-containing protein, partial [Bacteroidota bacterium]
MKKHVWKIVAAGVVILLAGSFFISNQAAKEANVGVELQTWVVGNPEASVVLTEYSDFQCPACRQFFPVVKDILAEYGEQIRFEYKHFPLISIHPFAVPAARAAEAAGQQGKFFEMHDILFEEQPNWSRSSAPEAFFLQYAEQLELDIDMFKRHMGSSLIDEAITDSYREAQGK